MSFDISHTIDSVKDGTKEVAETAHEKTSEFHDKYVSKVIPDCGKYGDAAKFLAELAPGVSEYNAIREGDWQAFAIAAGIDVAAIAVGAVTAGVGVAAVKGGSKAAKAGLKAAAKEVAEAGTKKAVKEVAEAGAEKAVKEVVEAGVEKAAKEVVEAGAEKAAKEAMEAGAEKVAKEAVEAGVEKTAQETAEAVTEKAIKEVDEVSQIVKNKLDGIAREEKKLEELVSKYGKENVMREQYLRNKAGEIIRDIETGTARRIDFIVTEGDKVIKSIEVTSETADKIAQIAKEERILKMAREMGGAFIKDITTGKLIEFPSNLVTEIVRL